MVIETEMEMILHNFCQLLLEMSEYSLDFFLTHNFSLRYYMNCKILVHFTLQFWLLPKNSVSKFILFQHCSV